MNNQSETVLSTREKGIIAKAIECVRSIPDPEVARMAFAAILERLP
jgi:hypothetical protein